MRKRRMIFGVLVISFLSSIHVAAATLNNYESEVIAAAKQTYEYNGISYQVDAGFIKQLVDYLSQDGVDLTADQRDEILELAFANVGQGVEEGYLIPVVTPSDPDTEGNSDELNGDESGEDIKPTDGTSVKNDTSEENDTPTEAETNTSVDTDKTDSETTLNQDDIKDSEEETSSTKTLDEIESITGQDTVSTSPNTTVTSVESDIIKNTGFNLTNTVVILLGMGVLMSIGILVTMKYNLFALQDE